MPGQPAAEPCFKEPCFKAPCSKEPCFRTEGAGRSRLSTACARAWVAGATLLLASCGPKASTVPLGLGPLAVAERANSESAEVVAAPVPARPLAAAEVEPHDAEGSAKADESEDEDDEASGAEKDEAASDDKGSSDSANPKFAGLYAGDDTAIFRLPGLPDREQRDDKAKIRIEKAGGENVRIVLVNSDDGSDLCTILARVEGNAALVESPQPCFTTEGEGGTQADLRSGRAVLEGDTLTMDAEGELSVGVGDQELEGELSYSFQGQRQ